MNGVACWQVNGENSSKQFVVLKFAAEGNFLTIFILLFMAVDDLGDTLVFWICCYSSLE